MAQCYISPPRLCYAHFHGYSQATHLQKLLDSKGVQSEDIVRIHELVEQDGTPHVFLWYNSWEQPTSELSEEPDKLPRYKKAAEYVLKYIACWEEEAKVFDDLKSKEIADMCNYFLKGDGN